mmetsp:Transcript_116134/g.248434  ORF Transcript_116134/g.248434 Transcript_116134/m.248434 type:complete len:218 (+) Transcript_116134:385-1038(+)
MPWAPKRSAQKTAATPGPGSHGVKASSSSASASSGASAAAPAPPASSPQRRAGPIPAAVAAAASGAKAETQARAGFTPLGGLAPHRRAMAKIAPPSPRAPARRSSASTNASLRSFAGPPKAVVCTLRCGARITLRFSGSKVMAQSSSASQALRSCAGTSSSSICRSSPKRGCSRASMRRRTTTRLSEAEVPRIARVTSRPSSRTRASPMRRRERIAA